MKTLCAAEYVPTKTVFTDEKRFQNRVDAFSEASARSVAENYDPNKLDPIVVWLDPKDNKTYVLSGHSRFAGLKRRGEKSIPVRYFNGLESEAIQFSKVDANRSANVENIIEDLSAYRLMRDGDPAAGLKPATKKQLNLSFKGKVNKLESWSFLDSKGLFVQVLGEEDRSQYPFIETKASWTGELRKLYPELTNLHERDIFNFLYSDKNNLKLNKDAFLETVEARIRLGKARLFPECTDMGCEKIKSVDQLLKSQREKSLYKEIDALERDVKMIGERLKSDKVSVKVHTDGEKEVLRKLADVLKNEILQLKKELGIAEKAADAPALFGLGQCYLKTNEIKKKAWALGCACSRLGVVYYTGTKSFPYDESKDPRQATYKRLDDYSRFITPADNQTHFVKKGGLKETVDVILFVARKYRSQVKALAAYLKTGNRETDAHRVWHWIKTNVKYLLDKRGYEEIRTPSRSWADRFTGVDCEDYSILAAALLLEMGYDPHFLIVGFLNAKQEYGHIYVKCNGFIIDPVMGEFNLHPPHVVRTMDINILSGVTQNIDGVGSLGDVPFRKRAANHKTATNLTDYLTMKQSDLISDYVNGIGAAPATAKQLRINRWLMLMEGTPNIVYAAKAVQFIDDVTPEGEIVFKDGVTPADVERYLQLVDANRKGLLPTGVSGFVDGLETDLAGIESLCTEVAGMGDLGRFRLKDAFKKFGQKIKKGFQKAGKWIKDNAGKVGHILVKIFPVTFVVRAAVRAALEMNLFGLATKLRNGYYTDEEFRKKGITNPAKIKIYRDGAAKIEKVYFALGGERDTFKNMVIRGGNKKPILAKDSRLKDVEQALKGVLQGWYELGVYEFSGLGEPITVGASVAAGGSVLATIATLIAKVGKAAEAVSDTVETVNKVKGAVSDVKNLTQGGGESDADNEEDIDGLGRKKKNPAGAGGKKKKNKKPKRTKAERLRDRANKKADRQAKRADRRKKRGSKATEEEDSAPLPLHERMANAIDKATTVTTAALPLVDATGKVVGMAKQTIRTLNAKDSGFKDETEQANFDNIQKEDYDNRSGDNKGILIGGAVILAAVAAFALTSK